MLVVDDAAQRETVAQGWMFCRPADGQCGYWHYELRELQGVDNHLWHINRSSQETGAQTGFFCQVRKGLGEKKGIGSCIHKRENVIIARGSLAVLCPEGCAAIIGTDGEDDRGFCYHRLVEVGWRQCLLSFFTSCYHNAVKLQVSHCRGALCLFQKAVQEFFRYFLLCIFSDACSVLNRFHIFFILSLYLIIYIGVLFHFRALFCCKVSESFPKSCLSFAFLVKYMAKRFRF